MVSWHYFVKVRNLKVALWLLRRGIRTYKEFVERLKELGVDSPGEEEFKKILPRPSEVIPQGVPAPHIPISDHGQELVGGESQIKRRRIKRDE
jgi:hypothetical protein